MTDDSEERGTPKSPDHDSSSSCESKCVDCNECPKCRNTLAEKPSSSTALKDFKVTGSRQSSRGQNDANTSDKQKGTEECIRDTHQEEKEDPMVKWFPDHISKDPLKHPLIPFPNPPPRVELRGGNYINFCHCLKRNGLQSECPLTGCQGNRECIQRFLPDCIPSGLRLPGKPPAYVQKADAPECYSKTELVKGYERVMNETITGGSGGIEGGREKPKSKAESRGVVTKPPSASSLISEKSKKGEDHAKKKIVRLRPNSPPNYISTPAIDEYKAPCRRHTVTGIPGSGKYDKYARCRLRKGKTMPKVIGPKRSSETIHE